MKTNELKELRRKNLLEHLMRCAIGYKNKRSAKDIIGWFNSHNVIADLYGLFKTRQDVEATIQELREKCNRKIGSSTEGYWMMCSNDEKDGYAYLKNQALAKLKTAIKCGIDPRVFYKALNEIKPECNNIADGQIELDSNEETKRYCDDIQDIKDNIRELDFHDHLTAEEYSEWGDYSKQITQIIEKEKEGMNKYVQSNK